jgi:hypothetical protein
MKRYHFPDVVKQFLQDYTHMKDFVPDDVDS